MNNSRDSRPPRKIHSDRLPTVKGEFFGREIEIELLNDAWAVDGTRIIQFIAPGGTGKTKLLRHWLDHTDNIDVLIARSFYSQGASEDKQIFATPFSAMRFTNSVRPAPHLSPMKTRVTISPTCCASSVVFWCWMGWSRYNIYLIHLMPIYFNGSSMVEQAADNMMSIACLW